MTEPTTATATATVPDNTKTYQRNERLGPLARFILRLRWKLAQPLQARIPLTDISVGEIFLGCPILLLLVGGISTSFVEKDVSGSGGMAALALVGTFLTASKANSLFLFFLGIPFERMIHYHGMFAILSVLLGCFHGYVAYSYKAETQEEQAAYSPHAEWGSDPDIGRFLFFPQEGYVGQINQAGTILTICMSLLLVTSMIEVLRRKFFDLWLATHIVASVGVIVFSVMHKSNTILVVALWWLIDLSIRYVYKSMLLFPKQATLQLVQEDVVQVTFSKPSKLNYTAGQYVQVCFPSISMTQFHAITISSAPHQDEMTLHIRALGGWSTSLVEHVKQQTNEAGKETLTTSIRLEGPYGSMGIDLENEEKYQMVLLASGGIGVTPCLSVGKMLLYQQEEQGRPMEHMHFVWAVPTLDMAQSIPPPQPQDGINVMTTDVHVTRSKLPVDEETTTRPDHNYAVHEGRPDWDKILARLKTQAQDKSLSRVAIIACGPNSMMEEI
ncbi:MAG: hypothetical protein SGILL_008852, partial [Bacillariaceae sp.]